MGSDKKIPKNIKGQFKTMSASFWSYDLDSMNVITYMIYIKKPTVPLSTMVLSCIDCIVIIIISYLHKNHTFLINNYSNGCYANLV